MVPLQNLESERVKRQSFIFIIFLEEKISVRQRFFNSNQQLCMSNFHMDLKISVQGGLRYSTGQSCMSSFAAKSDPLLCKAKVKADLIIILTIPTSCGKPNLGFLANLNLIWSFNKLGGLNTLEVSTNWDVLANLVLFGFYLSSSCLCSINFKISSIRRDIFKYFERQSIAINSSSILINDNNNLIPIINHNIVNLVSVTLIVLSKI